MPRSFLLPAVLALAGVCAALPATAGPTVAPAPVHGGYPFLRDAKGRVVIYHGVNAAWKHAPYFPPSSLFGDPKSYFDEHDAGFLAEAGLTHVRLGVLFAGVMPQRGRIDAAYLDRIATIVNVLGRHGIKVLLDSTRTCTTRPSTARAFPIGR
jgi:endoglycosylceramidase